MAQSLEGLALNLYDQGKFQGSVELLRDAVAMRRKLHHGPHPQLAEALNNLGFVIDETGQNREAEQLFREALRDEARVAGQAPIRKSPSGSTTLRSRSTSSASTTRRRRCTRRR